VLTRTYDGIILSGDNNRPGRVSGKTEERSDGRLPFKGDWQMPNLTLVFVQILAIHLQRKQLNGEHYGRR
jgi:hypothetical protein